jgi:hypothetical protein
MKEQVWGESLTASVQSSPDTLALHSMNLSWFSSSLFRVYGVFRHLRFCLLPLSATGCRVQPGCPTLFAGKIVDAVLKELKQGFRGPWSLYSNSRGLLIA